MSDFREIPLPEENPLNVVVPAEPDNSKTNNTPNGANA